MRRLIWILALAAGACASRLPDAPHAMDIELGTARATLRSDRPPGALEEELKRTAAEAREVIRAWTGREIHRPVDVIVVERSAFDRFAESRERHNAGALTIDSGGRVTIVMARPGTGDSPEADALLLDLARFHLAHELLHAACPATRTHGSDVEEGLANFIGVRALAPTSGTRDGLLRTALGTTLVSRTLDGRPIALDSAVGERGPMAYSEGWLAFEFAALRLDHEGFRAWSTWCLETGRRSFGLGAAAELARLESSSMARGERPSAIGGNSPRMKSDFVEFVESTSARVDLWCAPMNLGAAGATADGTMLVADPSGQFAVILSSTPEVDAPLRIARRPNAPSLERVRGVAIAAPAQEIGWSAVTQGRQRGIVIHEPRASWDGAPASSEHGTTILARGRAGAGEPMRIEADGSDAVMRSVAGDEVARWPGAALSIFAISIELERSDDRITTIELRPVR